MEVTIQEDVETGPVLEKEVHVGVNIKDNNPECCMKLCFGFVLIAICSPFIICDLYYAYTDDTCVHNPTKHLSIGLYDYLIVSGYFGVAMCVLYVVGMLCMTANENTNMCVLMFVSMINYLYFMFSTAWVIVGAVIFWGEIDNSSCSRGTYSYVMASVIIRLITPVIVGCANNREEK